MCLHVYLCHFACEELTFCWLTQGIDGVVRTQINSLVGLGILQMWTFDIDYVSQNNRSSKFACFFTTVLSYVINVKCPYKLLRTVRMLCETSSWA